jgi:hypothetical protein
MNVNRINVNIQTKKKRRRQQQQQEKKNKNFAKNIYKAINANKSRRFYEKKFCCYLKIIILLN